LLSLYAAMPAAFTLSQSARPPALPPPSAAAPPFAPPPPSLQPVKPALKRPLGDANDNAAEARAAVLNGSAALDNAATAPLAVDGTGDSARARLAKRARRVQWPGSAAEASAVVSACFVLEGLGPPSDAALVLLNGPHGPSAASQVWGLVVVAGTVAAAAVTRSFHEGTALP